MIVGTGACEALSSGVGDAAGGEDASGCALEVVTADDLGDDQHRATRGMGQPMAPTYADEVFGPAAGLLVAIGGAAVL